MKKNMLAVLILVISIVNLTLLAFMVFTVVPNAQKTDKLITSILSIIDLELESPIPDEYRSETQTYDITKVEKFEFEDMNANLQLGEDGRAHYAVISASLTIDTEHDDYKTLNPQVTVLSSDIRAIIINKFKAYTPEQLRDVELGSTIKSEILTEIQTLFKSTFIVDCTITYIVN